VAVIIAAPSGRLKHPGDTMMRLEIKHQSEWALQSSNGLLIVSGATGHVVQKDAPDLVLLAVRHVLQNIPTRPTNDCADYRHTRAPARCRCTSSAAARASARATSDSGAPFNLSSAIAFRLVAGPDVT
jgi:hypothetical protein